MIKTTEFIQAERKVATQHEKKRKIEKNGMN